MWLWRAKEIAEILFYVVGLFSAIVAACSYRRDVRRRRAKWTLELFDRFFARARYRRVRELIDVEAQDARVAQFVEREPPGLTEYLNFFGLAVYMRDKQAQIAEKDFKALFGYYVRCLGKHPSLCAYIEKESNDYEHLRKLLRERRVERG